MAGSIRSRRAFICAAVAATGGCIGPFSSQSSSDELVAPGTWTQVGRTASHDGHVPDGRIGDSPASKWSTREGFAPTVAPLVTGSVVYVGSRDSVAAFDADDGRGVWRTAVDGTIAATPAIHRGHLYVPLVDADASGTDPSPEIVAYDLADGDEAWRRSLAGSNAFAPTASEGDLFVCTDAAAYAIAAADGAVRWRADAYEPPGRDAFHVMTDVTPTVTDDAVFAPTATGLLALDRTEGGRRWSKPVGTVAAAPVRDGEALLVPSSDGLFALRSADGSTIWRRDGTYRNVPATDGEHAYVTDVDGFAAYDRDSGERRWHRDFGETWSAPVILGETVIGTATDRVLAVEAASGDVAWRLDRGSYVGTTAAGDLLLVTELVPEWDANRLVAFR